MSLELLVGLGIALGAILGLKKAQIEASKQKIPVKANKRRR
jgi:hypothetical protein